VASGRAARAEGSSECQQPCPEPETSSEPAWFASAEGGGVSGMHSGGGRAPSKFTACFHVDLGQRYLHLQLWARTTANFSPPAASRTGVVGAVLLSPGATTSVRTAPIVCLGNGRKNRTRRTLQCVVFFHDASQAQPAGHFFSCNNYKSIAPYPPCLSSPRSAKYHTETDQTRDSQWL
jgi:hypothetical protein